MPRRRNGSDRLPVARAKPHARQLTPHLDALQLGEMDYGFIDRLQRVHRNMKAKQKVLQIQFRLFGISK
jgi:hypothetical protein